MRRRTKHAAPHAFSIIELLIGLVLTSIVLAGAYSMITRSTHETTLHVLSSKRNQGFASLKARMQKTLLAIGYNPVFTAYSIACTGGGSGCVSDPAPLRIGLTNVSAHKIEFSADDSGPVDGKPDGNADANERYGFWVSRGDPTNAADDVTFDVQKTTFSNQLCVPNSLTTAQFTTPYKLYGKIKGEAATAPVLLSEHVLCMEIRYYRTGITDEAESSWVRLCPAAYRGISGSGCKDYLKPGPGETAYSPDSSFDLGSSTETEYFKRIRDGIQKIEIGILLEKINASESGRMKTELLILENKIPNLPWLSSFSDASFPS